MISGYFADFTEFDWKPFYRAPQRTFGGLESKICLFLLLGCPQSQTKMDHKEELDAGMARMYTFGNDRVVFDETTCHCCPMTPEHKNVFL
jgi:hypothetical protein